jgi:hypothetical protein
MKWAVVSSAPIWDPVLLYHEYDFVGHDTTGALTGVTGSFGLALHDPAHIRAHWSEHFDVIAIEEGAMSNGQDLVTLRAGPITEPSDPSDRKVTEENTTDIGTTENH